MKKKCAKYGDENPSWRGGRTETRGYVLLLKHGHPRQNKDGYVPEHILIAERALKVFLPVGIVIHHHNGVKGDNRNSNLIICKDETYRKLLHRRQRAYNQCGHAAWLKCELCGCFDDPAPMWIRKDGRHARHRNGCSGINALRSPAPSSLAGDLLPGSQPSPLVSQPTRGGTTGKGPR